MKRFFDFLQSQAVVICVFFGLIPNLPVFFGRSGGTDVARIATWVMLVITLAVFCPTVWWAKDNWFVQRPWRMSALLIGSIMGLFITGSALLVLYELISSEWHADLRSVPSVIFTSAMVGAMIMDWIDTARHGKGNRTS